MKNLFKKLIFKFKSLSKLPKFLLICTFIFIFYICIYFFQYISFHNSDLLWSHQKASLKFHIPMNINMNFSEDIISSDQEPIETYEFSFVDSDKLILSLEVQPLSENYSSDNISQKGIEYIQIDQANNKNKNDNDNNNNYEFNASTSQIPIEDCIYIADLFDKISVYIINPESGLSEIYKNILLFKSSDNPEKYADTYIQTSQINSISGKIYIETEKVREILEGIEMR